MSFDLDENFNQPIVIPTDVRIALLKLEKYISPDEPFIEDDWEAIYLGYVHILSDQQLQTKTQQMVKTFFYLTLHRICYTRQHLFDIGRFEWLRQDFYQNFSDFCDAIDNDLQNGEHVTEEQMQPSIGKYQ